MKWLSNTMIGAFILLTIGDIITTVMVTIKHGIEYETNPFLIYGIPLWFIFILRVAIYSVYIYMLIKHYKGLNIYVRYFYVYFLSIFTILLFAVVINNYSLFMMDTDTVEPFPEDQRVEVYNEYIGDMKILDEVTPEPIKKFKIPLVVWMFIYNMFTFVVWVSFERKHDLLG